MNAALKVMAAFGSFAMGLLTIVAFNFTYFESKADSLDKRTEIQKTLGEIKSDIKEVSIKLDQIKREIRH